ncbi:MAG: hypothetical protein FWC40_04025 [Proteobacteria bacterium]|nr:hypothetical protein [Pseudomonadota bacterium]
MDTTYLVIGAVVVTLIVIGFTVFRNNAMSKAVALARKTKDVTPIVAEIDKDPKADLPTVFNATIKPLWDAYERELACDLIKVLLERKDDAPISQYWLRQVLEVEPDLARKSLGEAFIMAHVRAEVAAQCGSCRGSCGSCK